MLLQQYKNMKTNHHCMLQTLLLRSSSKPTAAGKGEAERQQLDGGVDFSEHSFKTQTVLSGLLLQDAGSGELL